MSEEDHQNELVDPKSRGLEDQGVVVVSSGNDDDDDVVNDVVRKDEAEMAQLKAKKELETNRRTNKAAISFSGVAEEMKRDIVYDRHVHDFDKWLDNNVPSVLLREGHVGRIIVKSIQDNDWKNPCDYVRLQNGWKKLTESREAINYYSIRKLAIECNNLVGKWILCCRSGYKVDIIWRKIATAMMNGALKNVTTFARVKPINTNRHTIKIYNRDYTNESSVFELNAALREVGVMGELHYKPSVYSHLDIRGKNNWKVYPLAYKSTYDVLQKKSKVISLLDKVYE